MKIRLTESQVNRIILKEEMCLGTCIPFDKYDLKNALNNGKLSIHTLFGLESDISQKCGLIPGTIPDEYIGQISSIDKLTWPYEYYPISKENRSICNETLPNVNSVDKLELRDDENIKTPVTKFLPNLKNIKECVVYPDRLDLDVIMDVIGGDNVKINQLYNGNVDPLFYDVNEIPTNIKRIETTLIDDRVTDVYYDWYINTIDGIELYVNPNYK